MFNAYLDLGNWWGFTPYVGAGVGMSYLQSTGAVAYYSTANGQPWAPNLGVIGGASPVGRPPMAPDVTPPRALQFTQLQPEPIRQKSKLEILLEPDGRRQLRRVPRT